MASFGKSAISCKAIAVTKQYSAEFVLGCVKSLSLSGLCSVCRMCLVMCRASPLIVCLCELVWLLLVWILVVCCFSDDVLGVIYGVYFWCIFMTFLLAFSGFLGVRASERLSFALSAVFLVIILFVYYFSCSY